MLSYSKAEFLNHFKMFRCLPLDSNPGPEVLQAMVFQSFFFIGVPFAHPFVEIMHVYPRDPKCL